MADKLKLDSGADYLNLDSSGDDLLLELSVGPVTEYIELDIDGTGSYSIDVSAKVPISLAFTSNALCAFSIDLLGKILAGSTLRISESISLDLVSNLSVSDTLIIIDSVNETGEIPKSKIETLVISESAVGGLIHSDSASDTLTLTDSAVDSRLTSDLLNITELAEGSVFYVSGAATDTLSITDAASVNIVVLVLASDTVTFTDDLDLDWVGDRSSSNNLSFIEQAFGIVLKSKKYVLLQAPYDFIQTTLVLPSPLFQDTENLISNINLRRSMNGQTYTYVKSSNNKVLKYTFALPRMKGVALEEFCRSYHSTPIKLTNWKGEVWNVQIITNPLDFVETGRYYPTSDRTDINLEFEGTKVYG